ncbi:MAG: U32 family peptidase [Acidobacteria bacterium]|nr:U32 family peptidase [Acidobacteriota bacterium]MBI3472373.1 U32 family peptidase [Candidatus Solibacter usitatus]
MKSSREFLKKIGLPGGDPPDCPSSTQRFPDGGEYRIEIPSTEGPRALEAVLAEAAKRRVPVHRVSQGSGILLMPGQEIAEMLAIGRKAKIEVNLFIGPRATFDIGAQAYSAAGKTLGLALRGADQLVFAMEDVQHAVKLGLRSVLVSDLGILEILGKMRRAGELPADLIIKTSVMMAPANPAAARVLEQLGANTINIPSDLTLPQIAAVRAAIRAPIDFYVEAPDNIGGFLRYYEIPELIRVAAPIYLKFGLRNSPDVYPSGTHLEPTVVALSRERVRRAQMALEIIARYCPGAKMSPLKAKDLGIPAAV